MDTGYGYGSKARIHSSSKGMVAASNSFHASPKRSSETTLAYVKSAA